MSQGLNNRGIAQIAIGAACLAGAWYLGQRTSANSSGVLIPPAADLKAEDLVWNTGPSDLAPGDPPAPSAGVPAAPATGVEAGAGRPGPMIVEPDFSSVPVAPALQTVARPGFVAGNTLPPTGSAGPDKLLPEQPIRDPLTSARPLAVQHESPAIVEPPSGLTPVAARDFGLSHGIEGSGFRVHVVRAGETLQSISGLYFGTADYYLDIYAANQDQLAGPSAGLSGLSLKIPVLEGAAGDGG